MHTYFSNSFPAFLRWGTVGNLMLKMYNHQRANGYLWTHIEIWHSKEYSVIEMCIALFPVISIIAITASVSQHQIWHTLKK